MRDDDHDDENSLGKILRSGIDPKASRADYALPPGQAALEGGEPEFPGECHASPPEPLGRRRFLALGFATGAGMVAVGLAGYHAFRSPPPAPPPQPGGGVRGRPSWADDIVAASRIAADGSLEELVDGHPTFLMATGAYGGSDPKLWEGVARLATYARLEKGRKGFDIARRLLETFEINHPPARYAYLIPEMEQVVANWKPR